MTNPLDALSEQLAALQTQLAALKAAPPVPTPPPRRSVASTAAERIRQYVLSHEYATMPELQRELKLEKQAVHYYTGKLATEARVRLVYEPHEASHSLVKVACAPEFDVRKLSELLNAKAEARATG